MLAATQLQRDLHGIAMDVVEVLHTSRHIVPLGTVGDSTGKVVSGMTFDTVGHFPVSVGVGQGQVSES